MGKHVVNILITQVLSNVIHTLFVTLLVVLRLCTKYAEMKNTCKSSHSTTMNQTLADVIIPTFDIKLIQPMVFSTSDAKIETSKNALLADVCVATSAAPTFLPAQYFETKHEDGKTRSFNLIDWGGGAKFEAEYNATMVAEWSPINWIFDKGATPLIDVYSASSTDMVDIQVSSLFQALELRKIICVNIDTRAFEPVVGECANSDALPSCFLMKVRSA
ncbi:hypothetical protein DCAR_0520426 [Daucus carota subsp. sativus]|uniref:Uncharacterized protein n=1 Tax=Daucus carota subsp. sativus TaxID=79200 RepID=A0AAF0X5Y8_DAUCS|nr:hypothetical protein DCAR_0520426 [Daucus carota subsp. sativus]